MDIKMIAKTIYKIFKNSKKDIHILILAVTIVFYASMLLYKINVTETDKMSILSGISILASFFLLTLQNINFKMLNKIFINIVPISKNRENMESVVIRSTVFALSIMTFSLTGICFILKLFSIDYIFLLIWLINYMFGGIIYTIILWNYFASIDKND